MSLVSINIGAMEKLVNDMTSAKGSLPSHVTTITSKLDYVLVSTESMQPVSVGGPMWSWIEGSIRDLNRRLALARIIASSTPGIPATGVVEIDEDYVSTLSDAEIRALVDELKGKVTVGDQEFEKDIDPRVIEILQQNAHDPYFAKILAETIPPQQLADYLRAVNAYRNPRNVPTDKVGDFDKRYDALLNGLGMSYGLASQGTGDLAVPGLTESWTSFVKKASTLPNGAVQALSLVISRGSFSTDFLTTMHSTLKDIEGDRGASAWGVGFGAVIVDPDPAKSPESNVVQDPMGGLFQALGANSEAMRKIFGEGATTTVETDDGKVDVNAYLWYVMRHRGGDEYSMQQLAIGLRSGLSSPPVEGQPAWQPGLAEDVDGIVGAIEREVRIAKENEPPWWSKAGHFILDLVGLIPGLGEPADGVNAIWYSAEGNTVDAALSAGGAIPIAGWFAVGGKWTRRLLTADEVAALSKAVDKGTDIGRITPGGTVLTKADMLDPSKFTPETFLSPSELKRYADRPWLQNIISGNKFDDFVAPNYKYNEVYVEFAGNKSGRARLDSYVPGEEIISRKFTQLGDVDLKTAKAYIDELVTKYPVGAKIPDTPGNRASGLAGETLRGRPVLQVPPQKGGVIPDEVAEYARINGIRIVDINGFNYTP